MKHTVTVVGLGLIGASLAKALRRACAELPADEEIRICGIDIAPQTVQKALEGGVIDCDGTQLLPETDLLLVAVFPGAAVDFIRTHACALRPGTIVTDLCGVKRFVCDGVRDACREAGVTFVGGHPMAGKEKWGFDYADETLFDGASLILTPEADTPEPAVAGLERFYKFVGFRKIVRTNAEDHDRMIAYTSQLAHVVSNAYIKSPEAFRHEGYSAGSYKDLTRVARLNEVMWAELFLHNREALLQEIDIVQANIRDIRDAIADGDRIRLEALLRDGSERKRRLDG